jgi:uncharacterized protein (TIGR02147 family)
LKLIIYEDQESTKMNQEIGLPPEVRSYSDYRIFLKDFFLYKKTQNSSYSHRVFIRKAEMSSPSHLKMVIDGKRNLTGKTLKKYIGAIGLKKKEANFFSLLVNYNQETNHEEKIALFQEIMNERRKKGLSDIEEVQYDFLSKWHYVAIYCLLDLKGFKSDPAWISSKLKKKVSLQNIEKALNELKRLKLITENDQGELVQTNGPLDTSDQVQNLAFRTYHKNMGELAISSLENEKVEHREFNGVTIPIDVNKLSEVKEMIRAFRRELNEVASNMENPNEVYQMNIHFFPLTEVNK